jgi:hypothetical protein
MSSSFQVPSSPDILEDTVVYTQHLQQAHQLKQWFADQENVPRINAIFNTQPLMILGQTIIKYFGICNALYDQTAGLTKMINQLANLLIQMPQYEAFTLSMDASTHCIIQPSTMLNPRTITPPPPLETPVPTPSPSQSIHCISTPYPEQRSVMPLPSPTSPSNSPVPVPLPPPIYVHIEQPTPFIARDKTVLYKIIEQKVTKTPPKPQIKSVITKVPKKKPLTIFATPLLHDRKQIIAVPSPDSSKDSPIDLTEDYKQNLFSSNYNKVCTQCGKQGHKFEWCHHFMCPMCYQNTPGHLSLKCPVTIKEKKDSRRYMHSKMYSKMHHTYQGNSKNKKTLKIMSLTTPLRPT